MKLSTSTGDFNHYVTTAADMVRAFKESAFKYINSEHPIQCTNSMVVGC